ncbi:AbrB/MazE/SpoVT family DNA-binding domain-containing protein [Paenibacillus sp. NRS-1775]|uniref:AbrB/MazE/SpoVT family DNA-binding domain-containing protein n=1 Tax=unclassified Paenibacillus TaxID=185978 RepID=UPI003D2A45D6
MKRTIGMIRGTDDLGRIAIPKEMRRLMNISEGDPLELFIDTELEQIVINKYVVGEIDYKSMWESFKFRNPHLTDKMEAHEYDFNI